MGSSASRLLRVLGLLAALGVVAAACAGSLEPPAAEVLGIEVEPQPDQPTAQTEQAAPTEQSPATAQPAPAEQPATPDEPSSATDGPAREPEPTTHEVAPVVDAVASIDERLESTECRFRTFVPLTTTPQCFDLVVPESREASSSADVRIHVAQFRATGDSPRPDPVIYLEGGPGGHALDMLSFTYPSLVAPYLAERDVIVFDQRGAGQSIPALTCPEIVKVDAANAAWANAPDAENELALAAATACADRLRQEGHDLGAYNSVASANDLASLVDLLGYDEVNLLSISYGTRLAQTAMRLHPTLLRSVVLDSVVPVEDSVLTELPMTAESALTHLTDACAADAACASQHPDLLDRVDDAVKRLDEEPLAYVATDLLDGGTSNRMADGGDLLGLIFSALYSQSSFALIPRLIDEVERGDTTVLTALGSQQETQADLLSTGMYFAVTCHEEAPFEPEEPQARAGGSGTFGPLGRHVEGVGFLGTCGAWNVAEAAEIENQPIVATVPTLVLGGAYDPITPLTGGIEVAEGLDTAHVVEFPHEGHAPGVTPCGAEVILRFFESPRKTPRHGCVQAPEPRFTPESATDTPEMVEFAVEATGLRLSGVRPVDWTDLGAAQFARSHTLIDPTGLYFQNTFGTPTDELIAAYKEALGLSAALVEGSFSDPRGPWRTFTGEDDDQRVTIAVREAGFDGIAAILVTDASEHSRLTEQVLEPAVQAMTSG